MGVRVSGVRRILKRWSRRAFVSLSGPLREGRRDRILGLRILTYHRVCNDQRDPFAVPPRDFRQQMEIVSGSGRVVSLKEGLNRLGSAEYAPPQIVVTFDDGTSDFLLEALPVLVDFGLPVSLYVNPSRVGKPGFLDWSELRALPNQGVAVESHGLDHRSLSGLELTELRRQVHDARRMIEDRVGSEVTSLAYPFGTVRDFNAVTKEEIRKAGYHNACTSVNGVNRRNQDLFELRRTKIEQGDMPIFKRILAGGIDGWAFVDRNLSALQKHYA